jgi:AcrR family transcriptional regulator
MSSDTKLQLTISSAVSPERKYGGMTMSARIAQRRERFIEAGTRVFGNKGYHAGTVRTLCAEAGLTDRYFYESFRNTEDLFIACYEELTSALRIRMLEAFAAVLPDWDAVARTGLRIFFEAVRDAHFARITLVEVPGSSEAIARVYRRNTEAFATLILDTFRLIEPELRISKVDERVLGTALAGAVMIAGLHWMQRDYREPIEQMVENCRRIFVGTARVAVEGEEP